MAESLRLLGARGDGKLPALSAQSSSASRAALGRGCGRSRSDRSRSRVRFEEKTKVRHTTVRPSEPKLTTTTGEPKLSKEHNLQAQCDLAPRPPSLAALAGGGPRCSGTRFTDARLRFSASLSIALATSPGTKASRPSRFHSAIFSFQTLVTSSYLISKMTSGRYGATASHTSG